MKRKPKLIVSCSIDGTMKCFETPKQIALSIRRADFMKKGLSASLYLYSIAVKKQIDKFKKERKL